MGYFEFLSLVGARPWAPQDGYSNEKQTKNDQERRKNHARDADVSKLALKQTDAPDSDKRQTQKPERDAEAMKIAFVYA